MSRNLRVVAGLGKTGLSLARYLSRKNLSFILFDTRSKFEIPEEFHKEFPNHPIYFENLPAALWESFNIFYVSPGVDFNQQIKQNITNNNIEITSDIECFSKEVTKPIIGITGTNGKSTVTALTGAIINACGMKAGVAGNIGLPVLDALVEFDDQALDYWVLELSSFQLELLKNLKLFAATILNITPDHLDRHNNMEAYIAAKHRIYNNAKYLLFNRADYNTKPLHNEKMFSFGLDAPQDTLQWGVITKDNQKYLAHNQTLLIEANKMRIKGTHNWENAMAAAALAHFAGVSYDVIKQVLIDFPGLEHRCQFVRELDGVEYINDSKGTNVGATESALKGIGSSHHGKIVLIAGGLGKDADFSLLSAPVKNYVRQLILIGKDAQKIASALESYVPIIHCKSLSDAIVEAQQCAQPDDVVLLSPACASFDMFKNFNHRGEVFTSLVHQLTPIKFGT